jgi:antitoxin VapB
MRIPTGSSIEPEYRALTGRALVYPWGLPYNGIVKRARTLYIKNPAAHRLAEQLGRQMGVTLTEAVICALENQVRQPKPWNQEKIDAILAGFDALPVLDPRSPEEILGYDEFGLPS